MSWQMASFIGIGLVLVGGFAWYERSRPPSQVVALVAALAALAIAGRVAFAAIPNVKPTTDIVIFSGFALGAAPGFAVGALAGLVSNFWFGQGPWTPWQMAGWGLCGVLGAALSLGGRNVSRLTLAAVCGFAGVAYGALLNFSLMATYGGDLTWQRFGLLESRAIPFDAAHAIGNIVLALIAGPAMIRMLIRFRERFEWRALEGVSGKAGVAVALLALTMLMPAHAKATGRVAGAVDWLESVQNGDGGFGPSPGDASSASITGWAMLGLEAAGHNPLDVARRGRTPVDFLRSDVGEISSSGDLARTIVALEGTGLDPRSFAGQNLVGRLLDQRRDNGSFEGWPGTTAFSAIALRAAGASGGLDQTMSWLRKVQNDDGGWGDLAGSPSNADVTGAVMQALGADSKAADQALGYLKRSQGPGGGFALGGSGPVNSQSTAWAVQGMIAVGADPGSIKQGKDSASDYLDARQQPDGHYRYSASSDQTPVWVTGEVLAAAAGKAFPISAPPRAPQPTPAPSPSPSPATSPSTGPAAPTFVPPASPSTAPSTAAGGGGGAPHERFAPSGPSTIAPTSPSTSGGRVSEGSAPTGLVPSALGSPTGTSAGGEGASPWAPLGIGAALTALTLGSVGFLGRRFRW